MPGGERTSCDSGVRKCAESYSAGGDLSHGGGDGLRRPCARRNGKGTRTRLQRAETEPAALRIQVMSGLRVCKQLGVGTRRSEHTQWRMNEMWQVLENLTAGLDAPSLIPGGRPRRC